MKELFNRIMAALFLIISICRGSVFAEDFPTSFPASISGTVRDASGTPAAGVRVSFHPGRYLLAPFFSETNTDQNGRYDLKILQDTDTNRVLLWSGPSDPTNFIMAQDSSRNLVAIEEFVSFPTNLNLQLQPGIIFSGTVKDTDGTPVTNAKISLSILAVDGFYVNPCRTDTKGIFCFPPLPRGHAYDPVRAEAEGYGSTYARVEAKDIQTNHYEFPTLVLKKADKILAGNVIGPDGQPVAGADIRFSGRGQQEWPDTKSDSKGHFVFESVCEGEVQLSAYNYFGGPPGIGDYESANDIKANAGDTNIVIAFDRVNYAMPLINATRSDNKDAVISLLAGKADVNGGDDFGRTALYWAAENGYKDIVALLLTNKADVNAKDKLLSSTPLSRAAQNGNLEIVKLLLAYKSDVNALDKGGQTPLARAMQYHHAAVVALLRKAGGLEHGYDVERATGSTNWDTDAILEAIHRGDLMEVKKLLKANPSLVSGKDSERRTPLILAAISKRADIVEFFLTNKADVNAADMFGRTALHWAALVGAGDAAQSLLKYNADISAKADGGMTPLHFAARNGYTNVVIALVEYGAEVNATNNSGITPLRATETELQNGATAKEGTVQARIYAAKAQGYKDVIEWLRQHGGRE